MKVPAVKISLIIPCYNEELYIKPLLEGIFNQTYPENLIEVLCVDGFSSDATRKIITECSDKNPQIKLIDNHKKIVPFALNLAVRQSTGNPIIRLDAHTEYANDYIEKIVETFESTGADIVGGPMRAIGKTNFQKAVAYATSTKMGVGDSQFHNENSKGFVDTVYLGAWKREIFADVGYFDERMKRNQDDEFHYRARSKGKKIYLNPEIKSWYYPRSTLPKLFMQYFQYGLYKPLVLKKVKTEIKLRHLIPMAFVFYIALLPMVFSLLSKLLLIPLLLYILLVIYFTFASKENFKTKIRIPVIYPVIHVSYGTGFILGLFKKA